MNDLRDKTNCPSFTNLKTKDVPELAKLLISALEQQMKSLATVDNYDKALMAELDTFLEKTKRAYSKILNVQPKPSH